MSSREIVGNEDRVVVSRGLKQIMWALQVVVKNYLSNVCYTPGTEDMAVNKTAKIPTIQN